MILKWNWKLAFYTWKTAFEDNTFGKMVRNYTVNSSFFGLVDSENRLSVFRTCSNKQIDADVKFEDSICVINSTP